MEHFNRDYGTRRKYEPAPRRQQDEALSDQRDRRRRRDPLKGNAPPLSEDWDFV